MGKEFEILEHTSELKIRALGKTQEELFLNMMKGMSAALRAEIRSTKSETRNIKIESQDINALLVDFLNEVLYLSQVNRETYSHATFKKFSEIELKGEIIGQKVESFAEDIKAVTHHGVHVMMNEKGEYTAEVIFDV